jgi:hypothetical protein
MPLLLGESLEPRVGAVVGVERCNLGMLILATRVTTAKSRDRWSRVWGRWWVSRDAQVMQILATVVTNAEGHHHWGSGSRVGAVVGVERCNLGMQNLATVVMKAKSHDRWSRVWGRWWASRVQGRTWFARTWRGRWSTAERARTASRPAHRV